MIQLFQHYAHSAGPFPIRYFTSFSIILDALKAFYLTPCTAIGTGKNERGLATNFDADHCVRLQIVRFLICVRSRLPKNEQNGLFLKPLKWTKIQVGGIGRQASPIAYCGRPGGMRVAVEYGQPLAGLSRVKSSRRNSPFRRTLAGRLKAAPRLPPGRVLPLRSWSFRTSYSAIFSLYFAAFCYMLPIFCLHPAISCRNSAHPAYIQPKSCIFCLRRA